jgi:hypothetical protein
MTDTAPTVFKLADFGATLAGQGQAAEIRETIERVAEVEDEVVVDLEGVDAMSPSFAQELFGDSPPSPGERVRLEYVDGRLEIIDAA